MSLSLAKISSSSSSTSASEPAPSPPPPPAASLSSSCPICLSSESLTSKSSSPLRSRSEKSVSLYPPLNVSSLSAAVEQVEQVSGARRTSAMASAARGRPSVARATREPTAKVTTDSAMPFASGRRIVDAFESVGPDCLHAARGRRRPLSRRAALLPGGPPRHLPRPSWLRAAAHGATCPLPLRAGLPPRT